MLPARRKNGIEYGNLGATGGAVAYENPIAIPESWRWNNRNRFYGEGDPFLLKFNGVYYPRRKI